MNFLINKIKKINLIKQMIKHKNNFFNIKNNKKKNNKNNKKNKIKKNYFNKIMILINNLINMMIKVNYKKFYFSLWIKYKNMQKTILK